MVDFETVLARVGFHAVYEKTLRQAIDLACEYGFSSVQIETAMPQFFPERYDAKDRRNIRSYAEENNIVLKVHAPGEDFSLQTLHAKIQRAVLERLKEVIDFTYELGAKLLTVHPGTVPVFTIPGKGNVPIDEQYPRLHVESLETALSELSDYSEGRTLLCVENSPFTADVMNVLSEMLEDNKTFLTWDLAKMYRADGTIIAEVEDFFLKHLDKVRECHLHDRPREHG
ncbi:MAG: sugar phosphate isomerase/epimerase, partial [Candidatus Bathyarchaeota archaeon]|nr:sugar phosphate isomerase/epimerase [Candidatus Bathyarchaeota archaeon]